MQRLGCCRRLGRGGGTVPGGGWNRRACVRDHDLQSALARVKTAAQGTGFVEIHRVFRRTIKGEMATVEQHRAVAKFQHGGHGVADEKQRAATFFEAPDRVETFLLEQEIADRQRLVDDEDFRVDLRQYGEAESHHHAAGVRLHRLVDEHAQVREIHDPLDAVVDFLLGQSRGSTH